jgi:RNA polymerase sigma factor (sigma-70 family)
MNRTDPKSSDLYKTDFERHLFAIERRETRSEEEERPFPEVLASFLERIPELYHETVSLRIADGLRYSEIAERLSIPIGTVKSRLHRARQSLLDLIEELEPGEEREKRGEL